MSKTVNSYCFIIFFLCMCNFKKIISKEPIPVHLYYKGKYTSDIKNYEIVVPQRVNKDGNFISHLVSHQHSKRSTKELDVIFYKIPIGGRDYLIELTPNRKLISPRAVVEIHKEDLGKFKERIYVNESSRNDTFRKMFENLNIRQLKNTECHFSGRVKDENVSKAALSTCDGLAGFIQIQKEFYTIEPVAEHDPYLKDAYPHILYKADGIENSSVCHTMGDLKAAISDQLIRERRESNFATNTPLYVETLIVIDKALINHHQDSDCENYVLTVFNMAFNLFHDASTGLMITLTIVRIIRLEAEVAEMNLRVNANAIKTLKSFQTWQYEINPGDDSHPNHHDIALLLTRASVCYAPSSCGLLGLTTIGKACHPKLSAALCEDNGLRLGHVIAHEIGHLLGADHDIGNSTCNITDAELLKAVMNPQVSLAAQTWSKCSQAHFKAFFESGMGDCFLDEPEEHNFNVQDLLPGVMYNSDFQCKYLITMNARECDIGSTCQSLNCHIPGYACIITNTSPADGTNCGENMWCHDGKCLVVGQRPGAVDGNWGEWSAWSDCSRTCGSGVSSAVRHCDKPMPSHRGKICAGERRRYKVCAATTTTVPPNISDLIRFISEEVNVSFVGKPCETGRPSFRDIQCGEFDDWIYPEDGKMHKWRAHYFHHDNPCALYCISDKKQIAALRPRVVDGTMCYRGIRDICIGGICKSLPCDLVFESKAIEDVCGVCHGDGTTCDFSEGIKTFIKSPKGLTKLVIVPSGTRNIKVDIMTPTSTKIIVGDKETGDVYVRGKDLGMFSVPGSQAWLGMAKQNQEVLNIPGPVTKPLTIWIHRLENTTVKWSMALPAEQQRKPEFTWDFLKWGPCSANCGPGTQKSEPSCMEEKAGLVEDSFCADMVMPSPKVRPCQITKCTPRWMVGDWQGCEEPGSPKSERKRVVYCIRTVGEGEGESEIIPDSECPSPKPHAKEFCENRQKREDTEYNKNGNVGFFDDSSLFRSDSAEFVFHKKYDDYLTHFAAVSVPQRKCETIPVHLLSSPHFKHYFRILQTPEDFKIEPGSLSTDIDLFNNWMLDPLTQNKISPEFYKNTFSGKETDVSPVLPNVSVKQPKSLSPEEINSFNVEMINKKGNREMRQRKRQKNFYNSLKNRNFNVVDRKNTGCKRECKKRHSRKLYSNQPTGHSLIHSKIFKKHNEKRHLTHKRNTNFTVKNKNNSMRCLSTKKIGDSEHELRSNQKLLTNCSLSNFANVTENLREGNTFKMDQHLYVIDKGKNLSPFEGIQWRKPQDKTFNVKSISKKFSSFLKPLPHFGFPSKPPKTLKDNFKSKLSLEKRLIMENQQINIRHLKKEEFDGSGIRKKKFFSAKELNKTSPFSKKNEMRNNCWQSWRSRKKFFFSNPSDPMHSGKLALHPKKLGFKDRYAPLEDFFMSQRNTRIHDRTPRIKKSTHNLQKRTDYKRRHIRRGRNVRKKKRSSRKWKKSKSRDSSGKWSKDASANGCGETRNYLNNLFRDSHPKIFKQEPKPSNAKPVINTGQLVIDKDSVENQGVELIFQAYDDEENVKKFKHLVWPSNNEQKISLRGQEVFDLFHKLQQRRGRNSYGSARLASEDKEKIEINIKIPEKKKENDTKSETESQTTSSGTNVTLSTHTPLPKPESDTDDSDAEVAINKTQVTTQNPETKTTTQTIKTPQASSNTSKVGDGNSPTSTPKAPQSSTEVPVPQIIIPPIVITVPTTTTQTTVPQTTIPQTTVKTAEQSTQTEETTCSEESPEDILDDDDDDNEIEETVFDLPEQSTAEAKVLERKKKQKKKKKKNKGNLSDDNEGSTENYPSETSTSRKRKKSIEREIENYKRLYWKPKMLRPRPKTED